MGDDDDDIGNKRTKSINNFYIVSVAAPYKNDIETVFYVLSSSTSDGDATTVVGAGGADPVPVVEEPHASHHREQSEAAAEAPETRTEKEGHILRSSRSHC